MLLPKYNLLILTYINKLHLLIIGEKNSVNKHSLKITLYNESEKTRFIGNLG